MYLQRQREYPYAAIINDEYEHLVMRGFMGSSITQVPHIRSLVFETLQSVQLEVLETVIQEAVERGDHEELYNMSRESFIDRAYRNKVSGFEYPYVDEYELQHAIFTYLSDKHICYYNYDGSILNSPIGGGVW